MRTETSDLLRHLTGLEIPEDRLWSREATDVERMMVAVIEKIRSADRELIRGAQALRDLANKIEGNVDAVERLKEDPQFRYFGLNPSGEVHGGAIGRIDLLIATREAQIEQLKLLAHLHRKNRQA